MVVRERMFCGQQKGFSLSYFCAQLSNYNEKMDKSCNKKTAFDERLAIYNVIYRHLNLKNKRFYRQKKLGETCNNCIKFVSPTLDTQFVMGLVNNFFIHFSHLFFTGI